MVASLFNVYFYVCVRVLSVRFSFIKSLLGWQSVAKMLRGH